MRSLRRTTFLIILLAFGILISVTYLTSTYTLLPRFIAIENNHLLGDMQRVKALPMERARGLLLLTRDWAWWDDSYEFMLDRSQEFMDSNLPISTFTGSELNLIGFYDTMGQIHWGASLPPDEETLSPIPWDFEDFVFSRVAPWGARYTGKGFYGIARINDTVWILACEQILNSEEQGPHRGWLMMGRILEPAALEEAAKNAHLHLQATLAHKQGSIDGPAIWKENGVIYAKSILHDINGKPALELILQHPASISQAGKKLVRVNFAIISTACLIIGALAMWLLQRRVLSRISLLARQAKSVTQKPNEAYDITVPGKDEITALASDVNSMIQQVKEEERFLDNMMRSLQVGVLLVSVEDRKIVEANPYACDLVGRACEDIIGQRCHGFICPNEEGACPVLDLGQPNEQSRRVLINSDGDEVPILKSVVPITRKGKHYLLETFVSIAQLEATQRALEDSENRYRTIFMSTGTASIIVNEDHTVGQGNSEFFNMSGYSPEQIEAGLKWTDCFHPEDVRWMVEYNRMRRKDEKTAPRRYEARFINGRGEMRNVELTVAMLPGTEKSIASLLDITDRKLTERELTHKAFYDEVTGLPNRQLFGERLLHSVQNAERNGSFVGVVFLDISRFKDVNDRFGREKGDDILRRVGQRLRSSLRSNDTVARFGHDEYALLTEDASHLSDIPLLAHKVVELFDEPFPVEGESLYLTVGAGVALYPEDGETPEELMRNAELAMLSAKTAGQNTFNMCTEALDQQARNRLTLESELRHALEAGQIEVWYQPKVRLLDGEIQGVEGLVRWRKADGTILEPEAFLPFAEGTSLIRDIDLEVLNQACAQCVGWRKELGLDLTLCTNISPLHFKRGELAAQINEILYTTGFTPQRLELDITESALVEHADDAESMLKELAAMGISFALDDFGTGYSSLYRLKDMPVQTIKIDKVFVDMLETNRAQGESFIKTIVAMAESLYMETLAEGVEKPRQVSLLRKLGCEYVQGFTLSPPVRPEEMQKLLRMGPFKIA